MTARDLLDKNLDGWNVSKGYFVELDHRLMGRFPAIFRDDRQMVVCTDLELMLEVAKKLSPRKFRVVKQLVLASNSEGIGYFMAALGETDIRYREDRLDDEITVRILTRETFENLISAGDYPFMWAPGLVGNDMGAKDFEELIDHLKTGQERRG